jgi:uncharacterized damage-inducible protein DinB
MTAWAALAVALRDVIEVVLTLTPAEFTRRDLRCSGSIGAHVRHCLDHVSALERGIATGRICYDHRERDTVVETNLQLALSRLRRAVFRLEPLSEAILARPLTLVAQLDARGTRIETQTTVARELAFVISHTIHHSALIGVVLEREDHDVPERFGLAPTTPVAVCAR